MLSQTDSLHVPELEDFSAFIRNDLFQEFCTAMKEQYQVSPKAEFSKCSMEPGWNLKFKKSGRALCTLYPREQYFTVMVVVGAKEKEGAEALLLECCQAIQTLHRETKEGNGQRWLMIDLEDKDQVYEDALKLIALRVK